MVHPYLHLRSLGYTLPHVPIHTEVHNYAERGLELNIDELVHSGKATISLSDAADVIGIDPRTLGKEIKAGTVPAIHFGTSRRVLVAPLLASLGLSEGGPRHGK
jgi:hypothetical protein